jgi:uncharacterized protein
MFDLRSIALEVGEQHRQPLDVEIAPLEIAGEPYLAEPPVATADFAVTRLRHGFVFDERFDAAVHGPCHRCLEEAVVEVAVDVREFHSFRPDPGAEEEMTCEYLVDEELDTDRMATDAVVLGMPLVVLCRPECLGLCPVCGANLNDGPHEPHEQPLDERWAPLRDVLADEA